MRREESSAKKRAGEAASARPDTGARFLRVAKTGRADFRTIGQALAAVPPETEVPTIISLAAGTYREKLKIETPHLTIVGEGPASTIISYDDHAWKPFPSGERMNTFNSYTVYIGAPDFRAEGLCIENSAGDGRAVGQAIACYVDADRATFFDCRFSGHQDTLCLGPLPANPLPKGLNLIHPVAIAGEGGSEKLFRQYFRNCRIEGDIDFIFGSASAVFDACTIVSLDREESVNGYISAPSTLPGQAFGFVFLDCLLESEAEPGSVFLGRPWRSTAKVAFIRCEMGRHIADVGWDNWDNPENEKTAEFAEYGNHGPGVKRRVPWALMLDARQAQRFSPRSVLSGPDSWEPFVH